MIRISGIKLPLGREESSLVKKAADMLSIPIEQITEWKIYKKSLDARKKDQIHYVYVLDVAVLKEKELLARIRKKQICAAPDLTYALPKGKCEINRRPVVVGFGPAGMFAALLLAQMGLRPIVLERGGDVDSRRQAVERFWTTGELDPENNVQFGEGGAGTFSDGKLTTRIKDPRCRKVLEELVAAGAPAEILYDSKPHIGTDLLRDVVRQIRETICGLGGEVRFHAKATELRLEQGVVVGIEINGNEWLETSDVILALGHSARDTFQMLFDKGVAMLQKPFAVGVRVEHPQHKINAAQYGAASDMLPPADYRLTYTTKAGRGVYTFCMCPGGYVVAAASERNRLAVNGMSEHARDGNNANAALLVQVFPEDFENEHPLAGMFWQRELETKAFAAGGGGYIAPIQTVGSFLGRTEEQRFGDVLPTYRPGTRWADMADIFPTFLTEALREALPAMGRKLPGFDDNDAVMTAVESRSSSPVRILRQESGESPSAMGLYPTGEGAGYAGGIVSAAVDGIRAAEHVFLKYAAQRQQRMD